MTFHEDIFDHLTKANQTLSVAESCTGGGLANEITAYPGISQIFLGSITTYSNHIKEKLLKVSGPILATHGAVSEPVALLMAKNCKDLFSSTWALSTTGIAGPSGGSKEKPVGLVWIGIAGPSILHAHRFVFDNTSRLLHRQKTITQALEMLRQQLSQQ